MLLNEKLAAQRLGVGVKCLQKWRWLGQGPNYFKIGGKSVRYAEADLNLYLDSCRVRVGTGEAA